MPLTMPSGEQYLRQRIDRWGSVGVVGAAFLGILGAGTVAYRLLGLGWFEAFYQTLITVTTVGFTEIGTEITPAYRLVSSVLILTGVGVGVYGMGLVAETVMEGRLTGHVWRARMQRTIDKLDGHTIVCGWGQVGQAITGDLVESGREVVVIDRQEDLAENRYRFHHIVGDATNDDVLIQAGIQRAKNLVVALDSEPENLFVTLSGRDLNRTLFIVSRAVGPAAKPKLFRAGADRAVNPHQIGADRMASLVLQPNVAAFLGETMADRAYQIRMEEVEVEETSRLDGITLIQSGFLDETGLTLLAIRRMDGSFVHRPRGDFRLVAGDVAIVLGMPEEHLEGRQWGLAPKGLS